MIEIKSVDVAFLQRQSFFRHKTHYALRDISFDIVKGETLGIIGRNGCGKSTLLRVIAGIIRPDVGEVESNYAKVSLQTLAAGFDHELSGRDNAIISSMLLGHTKKDAIANMKAINDFAELGDSFNDPVKTYSSGMRARLGFSVAITMHADVLLVDEVLGVGDSGFRAKAEQAIVSKMNSQQTVVFVSHSLSQIGRLCDRVAWIELGKLKMIGETQEVINSYAEFMKNKKNKSLKLSN